MKLSHLLAAAAVLAVAAVAQTRPTYSFTSFGRPCGGDLAGSLNTTRAVPAIQMDVTNAAPSSFAILVAGHQAARPHSLPGSNCLLLVDPRITLVGSVDARGNATFLLSLPRIPTPWSIDFQAVTIALNRNGRTAESTDGVTVSAR